MELSAALAHLEAGARSCVGCTFVANTAEQTPASTLEFAKLFEEAGFPPGVFNVVTGYGATGSALVRHPGVDKVAFTGSTETGKLVMKDAADHIAKVSLELGGKSPNIVFEDADMEAAANGVISGIFAATGQTCMAGSRLFVQEGLHDELVERLAEKANSIKLGDPLDEETEMGPIAFKEQLDKVQGYVETGQRRGRDRGRVEAGKSGSSGRFLIEPTSLTAWTTPCRCARGNLRAGIEWITIESERRRPPGQRTPYGLRGRLDQGLQRAQRLAQPQAARLDQRLPGHLPSPPLRRLQGERHRKGERD